MQKKLIAAAVAALVSTGAMADVTTYGRVDFGYATTDRDTKTSGVTTTTTTSNTGVASSKTSSRLGWNISEDLGGGLSAFGNIELGIAQTAANGADVGGDAAAPFTLRTAFIGLKSDAAGTFTIGRQTTLSDLALQSGDAGGVNNVVGAIYGTAATVGDSLKLYNSRSSQLITYASPNFSGFSVAAQYGTGETDDAGATTDDEHTELGLMASYKAGPLAVTLAMQDEEQTTNNVKTNEPSMMTLAASYDFGVAKVYGTYIDGDDKSAGLNGTDGMQIAASFPLGAATLWASYYTGEKDFAAAGADEDWTGMQLGVNYSLSKRTSAYAVYGNQEVEDQTAPNDSVELTTIAVGIRHDF